ncbi:MAG TPA: CARDB domain-containing protein, partial [Thermoplasmata archaeon]|nr:CARDB domain-containing protein [Thermoplasmata archaeon]
MHHARRFLRAASIAAILLLGGLSLTPPAPAPAPTWFSDDFEVAGNWTATGLWHRSAHRAASGMWGYYFGVEGAWTYDTGAPATGALTSPSMNLTATNNATLTFAQYLDAEGPPYEEGRVLVSRDGGGTWTELWRGSSTGGAWELVTLDLGGSAGAAVLLRFAFDTVDEIDNGYEGWYVDDVQVAGQPEPRDLAVRSLEALGRVLLADPLPVKAVVVNEGQVREDLVDVTVSLGGTEMDRRTVGPLEPLEAVTVVWNLTAPTNGRFDLRVNVSAPGSPETALADNARTTPVLVNRLRVGLYYHDDPSDVPYWVGDMMNTDFLVNRTILEDTEERFFPVTLTLLTPASLAGIDVLVLADNAPPPAELAALDAWFGPGRGLVLIHRAAALGADLAYLWPDTLGTNGYGTHWDDGGTGEDQEVALGHPVTEDYAVGQALGSVQGATSYFASELTADTLVLTRDAADPGIADVVARQVPGHGKVVGLGPFLVPFPELQPMLLDAVEWSATPPAAHDVAALLRDVPGSWPPASPLTLQGTLLNDGLSAEPAIQVDLFVDGALRDTRAVLALAAGEARSLSFSWTPGTEADHVVEIRARPVAGETEVADNTHAVLVATWTRPQAGRFLLLSDNRELDDADVRKALNDLSLAYDIQNDNNVSGFSGNLSFLMEYEGVLLFTGPGSNLEEQRALRLYTRLGGSLLVTGEDAFVGSSPLEDVLGIVTRGDSLFNVNFSVVDANSPAVNGAYGAWPEGAYFFAVGVNHDAVTADPAAGTSRILRFRNGIDKLTYRPVGERGKALYWNGDGVADWGGNPLLEPVFKNVITWMGLKTLDLEVAGFALPLHALPGQAVVANVTVANRGLVGSGAFLVSLLQNGTKVINRSVATVLAGASAEVLLTWSSASVGVFNVTAEVETLPSESFGANNRASREIRVSTLAPVRVAVYNSWGNQDVWARAFWENLNRNWGLYGPTPVSIDYDTLAHDGVTLAELDALQPDVVLLSTASLVEGGELDAAEAVDLLHYVFEGHGLVSTGFTMADAVPDNALLGPAFGVRQDLTYFYTQAGPLNLTGVADPVARGMPDWYFPRNNLTLVPADSSWDASDLEGGRIVLASNESAGAVLENRGLYLITTWSDYLPKRDDAQLLYNAFTLSRFRREAADLAALFIEYPPFLEPNTTTPVRAQVWNLGTTIVGQAVVVLSLDGYAVTTKTVTNVQPGDAVTVEFSLKTALRGPHELGVTLLPAPGELPSAQGNNRIRASVTVEPVIGRVLLGPVPWAYRNSYVALQREARMRGIEVDVTGDRELTPANLARYDAVALPDPTGAYAQEELRALQHAVAGGKGLLVFGDSDASLSTNLTAFAGISWLAKTAVPGVTRRIVPHEVTRGVALVSLADPENALAVSGNTTALLEDEGSPGQRAVLFAVSEDPGRVAAFSDEFTFFNEFLPLADNARLAVNILEWLVRADTRP